MSVDEGPRSRPRPQRRSHWRLLAWRRTTRLRMPTKTAHRRTPAKSDPARRRSSDARRFRWIHWFDKVEHPLLPLIARRARTGAQQMPSGADTDGPSRRAVAARGEAFTVWVNRLCRQTIRSVLLRGEGRPRAVRWRPAPAGRPPRAATSPHSWGPRRRAARTHAGVGRTRTRRPPRRAVRSRVVSRHRRPVVFGSACQTRLPRLRVRWDCWARMAAALRP